MIVKLYGKDDYIGYWTYEGFRELHQAKVIDYSTKGNLINYIIYEIEDLDIEYTKERGFAYEILKK